MYVLMLKYQSMPQSEIPSCTRWFPRKSWRSSMQRAFLLRVTIGTTVHFGVRCS